MFINHNRLLNSFSCFLKLILIVSNFHFGHGILLCPSVQLRATLISNPNQNNFVCDCDSDTSTLSPGWTINCFKDSLASSSQASSPSTYDDYSTVATAFTVEYVQGKYIKIECHDSYPNFKSAMFQGFGVDEIDRFEVLNCPLPNVPYHLIFHRTSISGNIDRNSKRHPSDENGSKGISTIRSLKLDSNLNVKINLKTFRTLFIGLDYLESLTLVNHELIFAVNESNLRIKRNTNGTSSNGRNINNSNQASQTIKYALAEKVLKDNPEITSKNSSVFPSFSSGTNSPSSTPHIAASSSPLLSSSQSLSSSQPSSSSSPTPTVTTINADTKFLNSSSTSLNSFTSPSSVSPKISSSPVTVKPLFSSKFPHLLSSSHLPSTPLSSVVTTSTPPSTLKITSTKKKQTNDEKSGNKLNVNDKQINGNHINEEIKLNNSHKINEANDTLQTISSRATATLITANSSVPSTSSPSSSPQSVTLPLQLDLHTLKQKQKNVDFTFGQLFPKLKSLKLQSFLIENSDENSFLMKQLLPGLKSLENVHLNENRLKYLPKNFLQDSSSTLKHIYLLNNYIEYIDSETFSQLKNVENVDLTNNKIKSLNENVLNDLANLKYFRIVSNNLEKLPEKLFSKNNELISMDLSKNPAINFLPSRLLNGLNKLTNLTINDCNLTRISNEPEIFFSGAYNLKEIKLRNNLLNNLTAKNLFANNLRLVKLDFSFNRINKISDEIFNSNSTKLFDLNLYRNEIKYLNNEIFYHLKNLQYLNVGRNRLNSIDENLFYYLTNIREINLSDNLLRKINSERSLLPFGKGGNLRVINFSNNRLLDFDEWTIVNWSIYLQVERINLASNQFNGTIKIPIFYSNSDEFLLDLSSNQISSVDVNDLVMHEKAVLDSSKDDRLDSTSEQRKSRSNQVTIILDKNPLNCDCYLQPFFKYARSGTSQDSSYHGIINRVSFDINSPNLRCSKPNKYANMLLTDLSSTNLTCDLSEEKFCFKPCQCAYHPDNETLFVNCKSKQLNFIPNEAVKLVNYKNISFPSNNQVKFNLKTIVFNFKRNQIDDLTSLISFLNQTLQSTNTRTSTNENKLSIEMYFDHNLIEEVPRNLLDLKDVSINSSQIKLRILSLRYNRLQNVSFNVLNHLIDLFETKLYLGHNPYNCTPEEITSNDIDCNLGLFKSWLTSHSNINDLNEIICEQPIYEQTTILARIPDSVLCPQAFDENRALLLSLTVISIILAICLTVMVILYYRNRQTILAFIYIHFNPIFICFNFTENDLDEDKLFDAFVSYSSADRDVVMQLIEKLEEPSASLDTSLNYLQSQIGLPSIHEGFSDKIVPEINTDISIKSASKNFSSILTDDVMSNEQQQQQQKQQSDEKDENVYYNLCIHERDWLPGNLISWNIVNSVQNSRRTILILSKEFIQSIWFQIEFHTAYYQMLEDKMDRLIVIVRGELPKREELDKDLVYLLTTKTYLVWGEKWFWEKLRYALPHKKKKFKYEGKDKQYLSNSLSRNNYKQNNNELYKIRNNAINSSNRNGNHKNLNKNEIMKEYVEQTIANHFQLNSIEIDRPQKEDNEQQQFTKNLALIKNDKNNINSVQIIKGNNSKRFNGGRGNGERNAGQNDEDYRMRKMGVVNSSFVNETET